MNSPPFIIWANQRTASSSLFSALRSLSNRPWAGDEPFDKGESGPRQFSDIRSEAELRAICRDGWLIKHVFDRLPIEFNLTLARISSLAGYRHVRLIRADEAARLLSLGLADQGFWRKNSIQKCLAERRPIAPVRINSLLNRGRVASEQWRKINSLLSNCLYVRSESIMSPISSIRRPALRSLLAFLGLPTERLGEIEDTMFDGAHESSRIAHLVPNIGELRRMLP